jgi:hypothetical protein
VRHLRSSAFPNRERSREPAAILLAAVPGCVDGAVSSDQQHDVEAFGAAQCVDRLRRCLRDRTCNVEGSVDRHLDPELALMFQDCGQNVFVQQFNFRRDHPDGFTGRIENDDRVEIRDDDGLLCVETERGCPLNGAVPVQ